MAAKRVSKNLIWLQIVVFSAILGGCVNLPGAGTFKFATEAEREDALANADGNAPGDTAGTSDTQGNDTATADTDAAPVDVADGAPGADADAGEDGDTGTDGEVSVDVDGGPDVPADVDAAPDADTTPDADVGADSDVQADVPGCVKDDDCASMWTVLELGPCREPKCNAGTCEKGNVTGACDDGSVCSGGDVCLAGECSGTTALNCDDGDACSADLCDKLSGCKHIAGQGCEDGNACTDDSCDDQNQCVHLAAAATCSDNDACTIGDGCVDVKCVALGPTQCVDGNPCTDDSCASATGCVFLANAVTCDDGDVCTTGDVCAKEECKGAADACDDGNVCTDDSCNAGSGCTHLNNYAVCNDGNLCTPGDLCTKGNCVGLAVTATDLCDDGNPCTDESCDSKAGCVHAANTIACEDGQPCTVGDACANKKCVAGSYQCDCTKNTDCAPKEDGNPCNGTLICDTANAPYKCIVDAATVVVCNNASDSDCAKNTCNAVSGFCSIKAQNEGGTCDADGSVCTTDDICQSGVCNAGSALNCNDGLICTSDSCDKALGCKYLNNQLPCTDGNACTVGDGCALGLCVAGTSTVCDDNNACTTDSCSAGTGECAYVENTADCSDGNACSTGDKCKTGAVCTGVAAECDDDNVCTSDSCDPTVGCVNAANALPCDDNDKCTSGDACAQKVCLGAEVTASTFCDDDNQCTTDTCDKELGCQHANSTAACTDGNSCTQGDVCADGVCQAGTNTCGCQNDADCDQYDDADACNGTLYCEVGASNQCVVKPGTVVSCSTASDNSCRKNTCDPVDGSCNLVAQNEAGACDADGSVCTSPDKCLAGTCTAGATADCNDSNGCTSDSCDPATGCKNVPNTLGCDDGNACTLTDTCANSACAPGSSKVCNDSNSCTTDSCNTQTGACSFVANTAVCDDSNVCTTGDTCNAGSCVGTTVVCEDNNVCTDNSCNSTTGCQYTANSASCTDGNACTLSDTCVNKSCVPGAAKNCVDANPCTDDGCTTGTGACTNTANTAACSDASNCTSGDICTNKVCVGSSITCNDANACTTDSCDPATGCKYVVSKTCDDANPCTLDTCSPADASCTNNAQVMYGSACDDGNACTSGDYCWYAVNGDGSPNPAVPPYCVAGTGWGCDDGNSCTYDFCNSSGGAGNNTCGHTTASPSSPCGECGKSGGIPNFTSGTCSGTTCNLAPTPVSCDDGLQCTDDGCTATAGGGGCYHTSKYGDACDDGDKCVDKEACDINNNCVGLSACDDGSSCTTDSCAVVDKEINCTNDTLPKGTSCSDGDECTIGDSCDSNGTCSGDTNNCDDGLECTVDSCDSKTGCVFATYSNAICTGNAQCPGGTCVQGYCYIACDDGNPCTWSDNCGGSVCYGYGISGATQCNSAANCPGGGSCINGYCTNTCTDGLACTLSDACVNGTCTGTTKVCNDNNLCTNDSCDSTTGNCVFAPKCDDGNPCTIDSCTSGTGVCGAAVNVVDNVTCGTNAGCKAGVCTTCGAGTVPTAVDDAGVKLTICAYDYPVWGLRPLNPSASLFTSNGDNTITDTGTGLQWMYGSYSGQTLAGGAAQCEAMTYGGKSDWRLPTVTELQSINDYVLSTSSLNAVFAGQGSRFWAQPAIATNNGFDVFTQSGTTEYVSNTNQMNVRCVRGMPSAAAPPSRYQVSSDQVTVYDNVTGLVWQRNSGNATVTAGVGNAACNALGGGWRLPTIRELESIVDRTNAPSSFFNSNFPSQTAGAYWTMTQLTPGTGSINWYVNFQDGGTGTMAVSTANLVRCVQSCDDGNPCTTDYFDKVAWTCKHNNLSNGTACGGAGVCASGTCACKAEGVSVVLDDAGTPRLQCVFDYPAWGQVADKPATLSSNGDGTISDSKTLLTWQSGSTGTTMSWSNAKNYCDNMILAGFADWRLPSIAELESILDYTASGSTYFHSLFTPNQNTAYWSGRIVGTNTNNAWYMNHVAATPGFAALLSNYNARCVRGGLTSIPFTTRYGTGSGSPANLKDNGTGLYWQVAWNSATATSQLLATSACALGGGWHLPSLREMNGLVDRGVVATPYINASFTNGAYTFWTSSSSGVNGVTTDFTTGTVVVSGAQANRYVRCVK